MAKAKSKSRYNLGFGAVYERKTESGLSRWYLDYRDREGDRVQKVVAHAQTSAEAILALREAVAKVQAQKCGVEEKKSVRFADFIPLYLENYAKPNKKSWICDQYALDAHLIPYFEKMDLREVSSFHVEAYRARRLKQGVGKSTTNREMALLKKIFNLAIDWGYCETNPLHKIRLFSEKDNLRERVLSPEEELRLMERLPDQIRPIAETALSTGMRKNEILCLKWENVDLESRFIRVVGTKSGKNRTIPINERLLKLLLTLKKKAKALYVFPNPKTGKPYQGIKKSFQKACREAGIENLRFHDLRHTFGTRLINGGADIVTVKTLLGHHSVVITQRYTHTNSEQTRQAVDLLAKEEGKKGEKEPVLLRERDTEEAFKLRGEKVPLFSVN